MQQTTETINTWFGIDASLEISLMEYGILCRQIGTTDEYEVISKYDTNNFRILTMGVYDIKELLSENWFDASGFYSFIGSCEQEFLTDINIANCLQSMIQYHGNENILGSCYHFNTLQEINAKYGFEFDSE